jgi:hypothetical protein
MEEPLQQLHFDLADFDLDAPQAMFHRPNMPTL